MKRIRLATIALLALLLAFLASLRADAQQFPPTLTGSVQSVQAVGTGTTGAATATLPGTAGKVTYICGFSVSPGSATTAIVIQVTVAAAVTFTYAVGAPATAAGATGAPLLQNFEPCVPASAPNTTIVVTSGALGTGGANNDVNAWGYQQ